jgi:hypothetical protein
MKRNKNPRRLILCLSVLFFTLIFGCKPPRYRGSVSGRITDQDGNPIANARLAVMDLNAGDNSNNTSSHSDRNGEFYVPNPL